MYKNIIEYGIVGNLRTVALIGVDGAVDWMCYPSIDSPSVFAALLDHEKGGRFAVRPVGEFDSAAEYLERTNVLQTRMRTRTGAARLTDFMNLGFTDNDDAPSGEDVAHLYLYRILEVDTGEMEFEVQCSPRFDYARTAPEFSEVPGGYLASGAGTGIALSATHPMSVTNSAITARWRLKAGDKVHMRLGAAPAESGSCPLQDKRCVAPPEAGQALDETVDYWRRWLQRSETGRVAEPGKYRDMLERSELVLKLLYYSPTGAMAAAATTSLPEEIGGVRNWDYRYTWIRDAAFTLQALFNLGHLSETEGYLRWVEGVLAKHSDEGDPDHCVARLQIMYGLRGEEDLPEQELDHLDGYKGSRPVRIGNAAVRQKQHDIFGELMDAALRLADYVGKIDDATWTMLRTICDHVCEIWTEPDSGIWEIRGGPYHFTYSKAMCWVALDRGLSIAERYGFPADRGRWQQVMDDIRTDILHKGYNAEKKAFTQHYDTDALDAANLLLPILGFLPFDDELVAGTIAATESELLRDGYVYRYHSDDGLEGGEGAFLLCTFWYIDCLIGTGRLDEAEALLRHAEGASNHLGLFAEEWDPLWREPLGNFPQAFTHIGYVNSVLALQKARGAVRAEHDDEGGGLREFIRKQLAPRIVLNEGQPDKDQVPSDPAAALKESMNVIRGAFFDADKDRVAYERMRSSPIYQQHTRLSRHLQLFDPALLEDDAAKKAFWINLYNVIVIHGVIELGIRDSIKEVRGFFRRIRYIIGGHQFTPDDIEHGLLRTNRRPPGGLLRVMDGDDPRRAFGPKALDPRVHFALVCASSSCPPIGVYTQENLDQELNTAARTFLAGSGAGAGAVVDLQQNTVSLSQIFSWYAVDFGNSTTERLRFVARYLYDEDAARALRQRPDDFRVTYQQYDWRLNR